MLLLLILGNSSAAIFNFVIPRGLNGSQGTGSGTINGSTPTTLTGFLTGNGSYIVADNSTYLKTDASNGPLTGDLGTTANIDVAPTFFYSVANSCFNYSGNSYIGGPDILEGYAFWWNNNPSEGIRPVDPSDDFSAIDGATNIDCGLYTLFGENYLTVWYMHGQKATMEAWIDGQVGSGNWNCDSYSTGLFVPSAGIYAFAGYPSGWTLADTYPDPAINNTLDYSTKLLSDGTAQIGSDLTVGGNTTTYGDEAVDGRLFIGDTFAPPPSDLSLEDYGVYLNKNSALHNAGGIVGLGFNLGLAPSVDSSALYAGIFGQTTLESSVHYGTVDGAIMPLIDVAQSGTAILDNYNAYASFVLGGGGNLNISNFTQFKGQDLSSASSTIKVDNNYGLYLFNNSPYATNSWGIYNQDRSYLSGMIVRDDGSLQPANISDADAQNDSLYFSTTNNSLTFKDPNGVVHPLY